MEQIGGCINRKECPEDTALSAAENAFSHISDHKTPEVNQRGIQLWRESFEAIVEECESRGTNCGGRQLSYDGTWVCPLKAMVTERLKRVYGPWLQNQFQIPLSPNQTPPSEKLEERADKYRYR